MVVAMLIVLAVGVALYVAKQHLYSKLPPGVKPLPGPIGLPYIGRVHDVPSRGAWLKFFDWSKTYGPIYQTTMFGTVHVWISSEQVAHDLLAKRATIYSDRPTIPNLPDNRTSGEYLALLGRTDTWKRQRKLCSHLMHTSALSSLHGYPSLERDRFLHQMAVDPPSYLEWVEQFTSRTVSRLSWGTPHPAQVLRHTTFGLLETISPSGALPNILSFLRHVPACVSPWKKKEGARKELEERLFRANVGFVEEKVQSGEASGSFIKTVMDEGGDVDEARRVVGLMAIAGALTIGSPIQSYLLAVCHYPEWQRKLQDEIDAVLGGGCPQWEDRDRLPTLRAVVKEVIRWRPPVPTGIPHAVEKDDVYNGYFIPAGATIHALEWGITRDETMYPDPEAFNPARWLDPAYPTYREPLTQYPNLAGFSQFGFGRRTCQGIPIVEQDLFLAMGGLAWAFDICKKRDPATGRDMFVHWNDYTPLLIAKPTKFPFDAHPRSEEKMVLVRERYEVARALEERERLEAEGYEFADLGPEGVVDDDVSRQSGGVFQVEEEDKVTVEETKQFDAEEESDPDVPGLSYRGSSASSEGSWPETEWEFGRRGSGSAPCMVSLDGGVAGEWKMDGPRIKGQHEPEVRVLEIPGTWRWD